MRNILLVFICSIFTLNLFAIDGLTIDFDDNSSNGWWKGGYTLAAQNKNLKVTGTNVDAWSAFGVGIPTLNMTKNQKLTFSVQTDEKITLRIDIQDNNENSTSNKATILTVNPSSEFQTFTIDYSEAISAANSSTDITKINTLVCFINPGKSFTGTVYFDDFIIGSGSADAEDVNIDGIYFNQIGFDPSGNKFAIVSGDTTHSEFLIKNAKTSATVYTGTIPTNYKVWEYSQDKSKILDFSSFTTEGEYFIEIVGFQKSKTFKIKHKLEEEVHKASIKSFYYNRASTALTEEFAGTWKRNFSHPDTEITVHSTAATTARPTGTIISSSGGWYDAGDFNKYIVNTSVALYPLLTLYERYSPLYDTLNLNIPESKNNLPDILDESLWALRWMLTMQDTDGGFYHKLTTKNFEGSIMPNLANSTRYVVQKTTAATLDASAVLAQASRICKHFEKELPGFADSCLVAAEKAYDWAEKNPSVYFSQPSGFSTGSYGDSNVSDELNWARCELYITTLKDKYGSKLTVNPSNTVPSWSQVYLFGMMSLAHYRDSLPTTYISRTAARGQIIGATNDIQDEFETSAYKTAMGYDPFNFKWGSNGEASNMGMLLLARYENQGKEETLDAAQSLFDYVLGQNPLGLCMVTGFGHKSPMNIHHRQSYADKIPEPIPGFIVGGPQNNYNGNDCPFYEYELPALKYIDEYCSFSTNEIAINWSAPWVYLSGALFALHQDIQPSIISKKEGENGILKRSNFEKLAISPNPSSHSIQFNLEEKGTVSILNYTGRLLYETEMSNGSQSIVLENILSSKGSYILLFQSNSSTKRTTFIYN